jgi:two-component system NtrC family sensor kinase
MIPLGPLRRWSLTAQLITSYLVIVGIGALVTSLVGSWIVSTTMMEQERRTVRHDLAAAHSIYERELEALRNSVRFAAVTGGMAARLANGEPRAETYLSALRDTGPFDFAGLALPDGTALAHTSGDVVAPADRLDMSALAPIRTARDNGVVASTELMGFELLRAHGLDLERRARVPVVPTRAARTPGARSTPSAMVLLAAAPIRDAQGRTLGVVYAGRVLGGDTAIVDRVSQLVYRGELLRDRPIGSVTIFQGQQRIATTVPSQDGRRAAGTLASDEVADAVLADGRTWNDRAFVVDKWYVSAYEPIRNSTGTIIGMLHVGILNDLFAATRDRVLISFYVIAFIGFLAIIAATYLIIRRITDPLVHMAVAARRITEGRFDMEVPSDQPGEVGVLAESFNRMLESLRQMRADLEEWGRTLEEKVEHRTEELVGMRARVTQAEHLASLGMLSAGVAHEINNPLGGILALTSLTLEDTPPADPRRENLEEVVRQTERCRAIVKGLLEFSRQPISTEQERVDLHEVLEKTLSLIENQALLFNVHVERVWHDDLPPVMADRSELQQVFMNLVINAVQAMREQGTITLETEHDVAADEAVVRVRDTGAGIPMEAIDRIFDPFFTTKASGQGTGLGLSIAYGIVKKHGGDIEVESAVGKGTCFTVRFPVSHESPVEVA